MQITKADDDHMINIREAIHWIINLNDIDFGNRLADKILQLPIDLSLFQSMFVDPIIVAAVPTTLFLQNIIRNRLKLLLDNNPPPDPNFWRFTRVSVPNYPPFEKFLKSDERDFIYSGFKNFSDARNFCLMNQGICKFYSMNCKTLPQGLGKEFSVSITKTKDCCKTLKDIYEKTISEILNLENILGVSVVTTSKSCTNKKQRIHSITDNDK
jgi:hypothetical protein